MNPKKTRVRVNPQVREQATEWLVAFCEREVDASGRKAFDRWLRASPEHVRAYLQISALWESTGLLAQSRKIDVDALAERALSEHNVLALSAKEIPSRISSVGRRDYHGPAASLRWQAVAACILFVCAISGGVAWWQRMRAPIYETGPNEHRSIALPDGSTAELNARSRIKLHFTTRERAVDLIDGQVMFSVARNPSRAFIVRSDVAYVRAVGTQFDVYRKSSGTVVTVLDGKVAVAMDSLNQKSVHEEGSAERESDSSVLVSTGEQAVAASRIPIHAYRTDVFAATAWTKGKLVFDSAPLRDVLAEFNRVGSRRLTMEDGSLLDLHVSGVFPAADSTSLVDFLRERFGVTVIYSEKEVRIGGATGK